MGMPAWGMIVPCTPHFAAVPPCRDSLSGVAHFFVI